MKNSNFTIRDICLMGLFAALGMVSKPIISPIANLLTDFIKIPGGSVTAGFSMMFIVFCTQCVGKKYCGLLMGVVQAAISIGSGVSATVGLLVFITYTMPGIAVDLVLCSGLFNFLPLKQRMCFAGAIAVFAGALFTNMLYFRLAFVPFLLFYIFGIISGAFGGYTAYIIYNRAPKKVWKGQ